GPVWGRFGSRIRCRSGTRREGVRRDPMIASAGAAPRSEIVIIPARNEAARLRPVVLGIGPVLPQAHVVVIDDDSTDGTAEVALAAGAAVARHPFHLGYGAALRTGYELARRGGYAR